MDKQLWDIHLSLTFIRMIAINTNPSLNIINLQNLTLSLAGNHHFFVCLSWVRIARIGWWEKSDPKHMFIANAGRLVVLAAINQFVLLTLSFHGFSFKTWRYMLVTTTSLRTCLWIVGVHPLPSLHSPCCCKKIWYQCVHRFFLPMIPKISTGSSNRLDSSTLNKSQQFQHQCVNGFTRSKSQPSISTSRCTPGHRHTLCSSSVNASPDLHLALRCVAFHQCSIYMLHISNR